MEFVSTSPITDPVAEVPAPTTTILSAPLTNNFDYTRSLGPVLSQFALALRAGRILGSRSADGRIYAPPVEFDPATGRLSTDLVEVGAVGTVTGWTWESSPAGAQPAAAPFAWAPIRLDGADTALLHAVLAPSAGAMSTGMRVRAVWRAARTGLITDIRHFEPGDVAAEAPANTAGLPGETDGNVIVTTPIATAITHSASEAESVYLAGMARGKLIGNRMAAGVDEGRVYFPPRDVSPADGAPAAEYVDLPDTGIVTTFCIVNVPFQGQKIKPPYVAAYVLIDGTDIPFLHLILDCPADEVRMGMRVKAVWLPDDQWEHSMGNISHFRPTGEPDADYDSYQEYV